MLSIAACSQLNDGSQTDPSPTSSGDSSVVAPILLDISMIDGTTQVVKLTDGVVLVPPNDEEIELWGATFQDDSIAFFQQGSVEYELTLRPFIQPTALGQTEVTLKNSGTGQEVVFTLIVNE